MNHKLKIARIRTKIWRILSESKNTKAKKMGRNIMDIVIFVLSAIVVVAVLSAVVAMALFGGAIILGLGAIILSVGMVGHAVWWLYVRFGGK